MLGTIAITIVVLATIAILFNTKIGILIKGFMGLFIKDLSQTPEGAKAIYQEAIDKAQDKYNEASDALQKVAGQLETARSNLADAQKRLKICEQKCEQLVLAGKDSDAAYFADEREVILEEIDSYKTAIADLDPIRIEAEQILQFTEKELKQLKLDQRKVVDNLKRNINMKAMYDTMDELKRSSNLDKMMGHVKDGVQETKEMAIGAKVLHNSKLSTQVQRADTEARKLSGSAYLESLKTKHSTSTSGSGFEVKERIRP